MVMKLTYNCDFGDKNEDIYICINGNEKTLSVGESVNVCCCNKKNITIYTKKTKDINSLRMAVLFMKRLILNFFNIIIMNPPNKWYQNVEPFSLLPQAIKFEGDIELIYVPTQIDKSTMRITKPQLMVNNQSISFKIELDIKAINLAFITYVFDLISLLLYACVPITLMFLFSGMMDVPLVILSYLIILLVIVVPVILKIAKTNKEKKKFISKSASLCL